MIQINQIREENIQKHIDLENFHLIHEQKVKVNVDRNELETRSTLTVNLMNTKRKAFSSNLVVHGNGETEFANQPVP